MFLNVYNFLLNKFSISTVATTPTTTVATPSVNTSCSCVSYGGSAIICCVANFDCSKKITMSGIIYNSP
jgi:hypothetical protein